MAQENHLEILAVLAKYTGKVVSWRFLSQTKDFIPGLERFHNLISGIYKPAMYGQDHRINRNAPWELDSR